MWNCTKENSIEWEATECAGWIGVAECKKLKDRNEMLGGGTGEDG